MNGQKHDFGTPDVWTQQEKDELLDFLRYYVVPMLKKNVSAAGNDTEHHLRTRYPLLRLCDPPRPHEPGPSEASLRELAGMPHNPERER